MNSNAVFFYGPQGSGKTQLAANVAQQHGCTGIVDEWWPGQAVHPGALHVTHAERAQLPAGAVAVPATPQETRDAA